MNRRERRGWLRPTLLVLLGMVALVAALVGYVAANPGALVPLAATLVERTLQRTLTVDGEVGLELSGAPRLELRGVRFGNASWSSHPHMVSAGYLMVQIDLAALLDNRVDLLDLDLRDVEVWLEDRVDGPPNWAFPQADATDDEANWSFTVQGLNVERALVHASIGELAPIELSIRRLRETTDAAGHLKLDGAGRLNADAWRIEGRIGTLEQLLAAGRVEMSLDAMVSEVAVHANGSIGDLANLQAVDLTLAVSGPNADTLGEIFRMPEAFAGDVALDATIRPTEHGHATSVSGHVSQFAIHTAGTVRDLAALDGWEVAIDVSGPELQVFAKALQISGFPRGPFEVSGHLRRDGGDLDFRDVRLSTPWADLAVDADFAEFPQRRNAAARLRLAGPDISVLGALLRMPELPAAGFQLDLSLDATNAAGTDPTFDATLAVGEHLLTATGPLGEFPDYQGTRLTSQVSGPDVADIVRLAGADVDLTGPYDVRAEVAVTDGGIAISDAVVTIDPFEISGGGALPDMTDLERFAVEAHLETGDLAGALAPFGVEQVPEGPLALNVRVQGTAEGMVLERLEGSLGTLEIGAEGRLGDTSGFPAGLDLALTARGPDIDLLFDHALAGRDTAIPFTFSGQLRGEQHALEVREAQLTAQGGEFGATGRVSLAPDLVGTRLAVSGAGDDLSGLVPAFPMYTPPASPWQLAGTIAIPEAGQVRVADGQLRLGSATLTGSGSLDLASQSGTDLDLSAQGESLAEIGRFGADALPAVPFRLDVGLDGTPSAIRVSRLEARWAESDLSATGTLDTSATPRLMLRGTSEVLRTADLLVLGDDYGGPAGSAPGAGSSRLFSDEPLPLDALRAMDADVDISVGTLHDHRARLRDVSLAFDLSQGTLALSRMHFRDAIGRFDGSGVLRPEGTSGRAHLEWRLHAEDADLGLFTSTKQPPDTVPRYTVAVSAAGAGASIAEIAGSLNGRVLVHSMEGGRIDNALLDLIAGDFVSNVLKELNPLAGNRRFTPMNCLVLNALIEDGEVQLVPGFVMRTDQVNMFVFGGADLGTERLDLSLATQARRGIGISAATITNPYFKVGGTITSPSLHLDARSAAVAASVATATAGLSIVVQGLFQRIRGETNPCPAFRDFERK